MMTCHSNSESASFYLRVSLLFESKRASPRLTGNFDGSATVTMISEGFILIIYKFPDRVSDTSRRGVPVMHHLLYERMMVTHHWGHFSLTTALCNVSSLDLVRKLHFCQGMELIFTSPLAAYIVYDKGFYLFFKSPGSETLCLLFLVSQQGRGAEYKYPVPLNHYCWGRYSRFGCWTEVDHI